MRVVGPAKGKAEISCPTSVSNDTINWKVCSRPSNRECYRKIQFALGKVRDGDWAPADASKLNSNFLDLDLITAEEQTRALMNALQEITPHDYKGSHPPQMSYEPLVRGAELFAFAWASSSFGCRMYLKFCVFREEVYFFSLHKERQGGDES